MSFGTRVSATKIELIKIRRSMQVAKMVHKILDDKREVLLKKIDEMIEEANKARGDIWSPLGEIYTAVYDAYMSLGTGPWNQFQILLQVLWKSTLMLEGL